MRTQDIMTTPVVTARPTASVHEIAELMIEHRIGGVPVVDIAGELVGIVTDGDLYRRAELDSDRVRHSWLEWLSLTTEAAVNYTKAHGRTARDVMTEDVVSVAPEATLREVADVLSSHQIHRVPVVGNGKVVGIVSRANLVQALALTPNSDTADALSDRQIRDLVLAEYKRLPWGIKSEKNIIVMNGVVHVWGTVTSAEEAEALRIAVEAIPGTKGFKDHLARLHRLFDV